MSCCCCIAANLISGGWRYASAGLYWSLSSSNSSLASSRKAAFSLISSSWVFSICVSFSLLFIEPGVQLLKGVGARPVTSHNIGIKVLGQQRPIKAIKLFKGLPEKVVLFIALYETGHGCNIRERLRCVFLFIGPDPMYILYAQRTIFIKACVHANRLGGSINGFQFPFFHERPVHSSVSSTT